VARLTAALAGAVASTCCCGWLPGHTIHPTNEHAIRWFPQNVHNRTKQAAADAHLLLQVASCLASMTDSAPCPIAKLWHAPQHRRLELSEHPVEVRLTDSRGIAEFPGSFFRHGPKLWIRAFPQLQAEDLGVLDALQQLNIAGCTISRTVQP
jgi:hypothetical protein